MAGNTTTQELMTDHPVLEAIAEFRDALNRLIDEQKSVFLDRAFEADTDEFRTAPSRVDLEPMAPPVAPRPRRPVAPPARAGGAVAVTETRAHESPADPQAAADDPDGPAEPRDPRQRLDALARLLDKRARQTGPPPADGPKTDLVTD